MTRIIKCLLISISSVTRSCDAVSDQKLFTTQKHARDGRCCVVRDAIMTTALILTCSINELLPLLSEFSTFYFPISNFKSMLFDNYQTYTKNKDTYFFTKI